MGRTIADVPGLFSFAMNDFKDIQTESTPGGIMQRIEVITNFKSNTILLKQGRFFIQCELPDADALLKDIAGIKDIMQNGLARRLLPEHYGKKKDCKD